MEDHMSERRRTLPVVKVENDNLNDSLPKHVLPMLEASKSSAEGKDVEEKKYDSNVTEANQFDSNQHDDGTSRKPSTASAGSLTSKPLPSWLKLNSGIAKSKESSKAPRHSIGLDVPGAVHTITKKLNSERPLDSKLVVIMVGLPARGKSYLVKKLRRYLNWLQYETKVFNVGNVRRVCESSTQDQSASFFDPNNKDTSRIRDEIALSVLEQLIGWLKEGGRVAIHDATNSTLARRKLLVDRLEREPEIRVLMIESVCNDQTMLERNFRLKLSGPDYKNKDPVEALADFRSRVANYEKAYQPVGEWEEENDIQFCKLINVGKKVIAYNISGYLSGQCIFYLMNFNLNERQIFVTRHGESEDNVTGRIGGDAPLSEKGIKFAKALAKFVETQRIKFACEMASKANELEPEENQTPANALKKTAQYCNQPFTVWTSMLQRSMKTAEFFDPDDFDVKHIRFLNEINSGICEGMTYQEILQKYPEEYKARKANKLFYRYPGMGGESYIDVIHRLQSMIVELERMTQSCLIITHRVVMRILLGYLLDWTREEMPHMMVPIHTVYELRPKPYGTELKKWQYIEETDCFIEF
ncbi:6-phosphofructo-2-kinase-domain-containing protein [Mycotypha africana]|uniref:6-phosphofructo-2-kinase-domain-containing protein n=1 Tax=Mycotypha africana TaxID=64632 RepID=UPI00230076C9|nr:6-phosphofructo-2-kinase-domain-containing protein [Mycotypha africana]KAI8991750.1 6-phosphofructo-2-kinase-domain-containing protein [Mycotypha africana]